ncbi:MAG: TusE/DsrC/DsvC family sulfur relay protein [Candidatus Sericytochromatia bacterium]
MIAPEALHPHAATGERVYLDHAATSPLRPAVAEAMAPWWNGCFGNAASGHAEGQRARVALREARAHVADLVGAEPGEVVFTSGATEANNLAVRGGAHARRNGGKRLVATRIEHAATRAACEEMAVAGWHVTLLGVDGTGRVHAGELEAITHGTAVVSVIAGHNELGTIQPLSAIAEAAHRVGALFHIDAVQAAGYLDLGAIPWDLCSLSAHKLGGPQGVGALVRRGLPAISPLVVGGSQEGGLRPGTVPMALVVGFGAAAAAVAASRAAEAARLGRLRAQLAQAIEGRLPLRRLGGTGDQALPHILSYGLAGVSGEELVHWLDRAGLSVSSSSACLSGARSPVLDAIGLAGDQTMLRLSLGWSTDEAALAPVPDRLTRLVERLLAMPAFDRRGGPFAQRAEEAGLELTDAHWEAAEGLFDYYQAEGVLPGARALARRVPHGARLEALFPYGLSTLAYWLGLPIPRGGCRPYAG